MGAFRIGRLAFAMAAALGLGGAAAADEPGLHPVSQKPLAEIFYGSVKVAPRSPIPPIPIVEVKRTPAPEDELPKPKVEAPIYIPVVFSTEMLPHPTPKSTPMSVASPSGVMPATYEFTLPRMQSPMMAFLASVVKRLMPVVAPHPTTVYTATNSTAPTVIIIRESATDPKPQQITLPSAPPAQVVFVHEPTPAPAPIDPKPAAPEAAVYKLSPEMAVTAGVGVVCLLGVAVALARGGRAVTVTSSPATSASMPVDYGPSKDGPMLMGQYRAGQLPDTAERFDIGPSYRDEVRAKQRDEEMNKQAVVAHILDQNLNLFDTESAEADDDEFTVEVRG